LDDVDSEEEKNAKEVHSPKLAKLKGAFALPDGEELLKKFRCTLDLKIGHAGTMYITYNYILFYSTFPTKETRQIALTDIAVVEKKKTAFVIPNGIEIRTKEGQSHTFSSFLHRDDTFNVIERARIDYDIRKDQQDKAEHKREKEQRVDEINLIVKNYNAIKKIKAVEIEEPKQKRFCQGCNII